MSLVVIDLYMSKARKQLSDGVGRRHLHQLRDDLNDVQRIMMDNIDDVLQRGAALTGNFLHQIYLDLFIRFFFFHFYFFFIYFYFFLIFFYLLDFYFKKHLTLKSHLILYIFNIMIKFMVVIQFTGFDINPIH